MYNPFPLLTPSLLIAQLSGAKGKRFFVRQAFPRGMHPGLKGAFLFRAYCTEEKELAQLHFKNLRHDPYAFLYDTEKKEHLEKLKTAARQPGGFQIYYVGKTKLDWKPPPHYQNKIKGYIQQKHAGWRTSRGKNKVMVGLHESFGDIFLKFSFESDSDTIPFDEIEKY